MAEERQSSEHAQTEPYEFVPAHLRHHFKVRSPRDVAEEGNQTDPAEQEAVRRARQTRSAHLVATSVPPPGLTQVLYSTVIERGITSRMTFSRSVERLEQYFLQLTTQLKQLEEAQDPSGVPEWISDRRVKLPTLVQTQRQIVNVCQGCLSDCDLYLGIYEALPSPSAASSTPVIRFVACSAKSAMLHQTLPCLVPQDQAVQDQQQPEIQTDRPEQQEQSMGVTLQAVTTKTPVIVDDIAELDPETLHLFTPNATVAGPFACFPLLTGESRVIGVISVDSCRKARRLLPQAMSVEALHAFLLRMQLKDAAMELKKAKIDGARFLALTENELRHKPTFQRLKVTTRAKLLEVIRAFQRGSRMHLPVSSDAVSPRFFTQDDDALQFLADVSKLSGEFLDSYRSFHWLQEIANITRNPTCSAYDVYDILIRAITQSLGPLKRVAIWKITKKKLSASSSSSIPWEIDVVASTEVPDDRVLPFLEGQERKIKRIALFKEKEEGGSHPQGLSEGERDTCAPFIRGGIVNVLVNSRPSPAPSTLPCEAATYHISWSDRSFQATSWCQLRQLLPIRNMNAKHFQLRHLCQRLQQEERDEEARDPGNSNPKAVVLKNPNALALVIRDVGRSSAVKYALEVDFAASFEIPRRISTFLERTVAIAEQKLECVRGREARAAKRQRSVVKNVQLFQSIGLTPSADALRTLGDIVGRVFQDIAANLPGVHLQIAELQADGAQLKYTFAGNGSTLLNRSLNRGQGVSFKCLDTKQPLVVEETSEFRSRLRRMAVPRSHSSAATALSFPNIFIPLFHEDCAVGVLSVDSFERVPKGRRDEAHPEAGVLEFLSALGKLLASAIYAKRRSSALYELQTAAREPLRSPQQLLFYACQALKDVVIGAWKVRVVELDGARGKTTAVYDFSEMEREQASSWLVNVVRPMAFRWKELLPETILEYLKQMEPDKEHSMDSVGKKLLAAIREEERERQEAARRYEQLVEAGMAAVSGSRKAEALEMTKFLERQVVDRYFLIRQEELLQVPRRADLNGAERITNTRYISHALSAFLGTTTCLYSSVEALTLSSSKVFLTISMWPKLHALCDQIYVQRVADVTSKYLTALHDRVQRSRMRVQALSEFRVLCQEIPTIEAVEMTQKTKGGRFQHRLSPAKELEIEALLQFQRDTIALIERTLSSPNVYFGMWEPALRVVRYTSASQASVMTGKKLKRGYGVSFQALETQLPVVITSQDAVKGDSSFKKLRFFTNEVPEDRKWPFIVVPVDNLGVLALDNMTKYEEKANESQPELGIVDFLRQIGQNFAEVLVKTRENSRQERRKLREDALLRVMTACEDLKQPVGTITGSTALFLPHLVLQQLENALNGVNAYVGLVEPLCERIRFVCASSHSQMENEVVDTVESVSFRVFAEQRSLVIPQLTQHYKQQQHQHESQHQGQASKLKYFGSVKPPRGPFVCVPIPFVGVLSVDSFPGAASGVFTHVSPEDGVVTFLERVANHLGENLRLRAATEARKQLPSLFRGNRTTFPRLFEDVLAVISKTLLAVVELRAVRVERDSSSGYWDEKAALATLQRSTSQTRTEYEAEEERQQLSQCLEQRWRLQEQEQISVSASVYPLPSYPEVLVVHCASVRDVEDDEAALQSTVLVLRRVKGATWTYDQDFLLSIVPLIDSLITQVNFRIEGIVARRMALRQLDVLCESLERLPSKDAVQTLYTTMLPATLEIVAQAMSRGNCDVYLGERESLGSGDSNASQLQLRFVAASRQSLTQNVTVSLANVANQSMAVVQCLQTQQAVVVPFANGVSPLRSLTPKTAHRVFLGIPMGENHVLCGDSLGPEALLSGQRLTVEADVMAFFKASAGKLQDAILSTRHRQSYNQLRRLTLRAHADLRLFFASVLEVLRRDLVLLHSQQIVTLGTDFTSAFRLETWQGTRTRRPLAMPTHFCSFNNCERTAIAHEIHVEAQTFLPMSNLPRTLDRSRARMQPAEGTEQRGVFACSCLATMLDSAVVQESGEAKLALCVFSHDAKTSETERRAVRRQEGNGVVGFTAYQRQYFFAVAAVAADVFTHVLRACVLETFATELLAVLQERLGAKDGVVIRLAAQEFSEEGVESNESTATDSATIATVLASQQPAKYPKGRALRGNLERKVRQFQASNAPLAIFMTRQVTPTPPNAATKVNTSASAAQASEATAGEGHGKPARRGGPSSLFQGHKLFRYGKKKKQQEEEERAKQQQMLLNAAPALQALTPSRTQQLQTQTVTLHVFVRALAFQGRCDVIVLSLEQQAMAAVDAVERCVRQIVTQTDAIAARIKTQPPRGDEEVNAMRFCVDPSSSSLSDGRGGGGFLLLSLLKDARERFQQVEGALGAAIRQFLTGAQATARLETTSSSQDQISTLFNEGEDAGLAAAATALLRVALVACGSKREASVALNRTELLKEFLRSQTGRKLLEMEPTDKKHWSALGRARTLLRTSDTELQAMSEHSQAASDAISATIVPQKAELAVSALKELLLTQLAVLRYLQLLETELIRDQRRLREAPAITLQCFVRRTQAQKQLKKRRREFHAARDIQCAYRQHLARRRLLFMKWTRAAIKVQRAYRRKRQRAKGSRPRRLTVELMAASLKYGALGSSASTPGSDTVDEDAWRLDMAAFGSFQEFMASKVGREQLKKAEALIWRQRKQLEKERAQLPRDEALREDVEDLFELLDEAGSGELSRERTTALITRLHVPLSTEEVSDVVAMMDSDGSGGISLDEFLRWFAYEFPLLQKRAPRVCGVLSRQDWRWVIQQSARSATLMRWRAMRAGAGAAASLEDEQELAEEEEEEED
ncbi:hypothetical protein BBJ28_00006250 [Nothophytophthora sp. Chile5]|nr:hypothetical protein BBJ28_00006250 [Nothophytophthora sp. Chile5]